VHVQVGIDQGIQNILGQLNNSTDNAHLLGILARLCPGNCNNNGQCLIGSIHLI
jgi:hypothetical protein